MRTKLSLPVLAAILGTSVFASYAAPALSSPLTLSYEELSTGTTGLGTINTPGIPSSSTYGNSFTAPTVTIPTTAYGFYDDYLFSISGATANSITTTIDLDTLQISNLQERLYNSSGNLVLPVLGAPVGGAIDAWISPIGTSGTVAVLPTTVLSAGTYVLEIRGNVTGSSGGSYAGTLNIVPVPLPAALPMMLAGLGLLGRVARRRATS
jgi:hypothetical protein